MKTIKLTSLFIVAFLLLFNIAFAADYVEGEVLIQYRDGAATTRSMSKNARSIMSAESMPEHINDNLYLIKSKDNVTNTIESLKSDPNILFSQPNFKKYAYVVPDDMNLPPASSGTYRFSYGKGINMVGDIGVKGAWDIVTDASSVKVGVVDSGVQSAHEDLAANMIKSEGFDAFGSNGGEDGNGHGTHVAGIIGAVGDNGKGTVGMAWKTKMISVRVLNNAGTGSTYDEMRGLGHAIDKKAQVLNMSLGGDSYTGQYDPSEYAKLKEAISKGIVIVAAAGNNSLDTDDQPLFPAAYGIRGLISVGASDANIKKSVFGNQGGKEMSSCYGQTSVHVFAPGSSIYSTIYNASNQNSYAYKQGTSMATPAVTGAVTLMLANDPTLTPWQVEQIVINSAIEADGLKTFAMSNGVLDTAKALQFDKRLLFEAPDNLQYSLVSGTARTVKLTWSAHKGQTEIWARTNTGKFTLLDRVAAGVTEYTDRAYDREGNGKRYYRIRGLKHATYTPFVRRAIQEGVVLNSFVITESVDIKAGIASDAETKKDNVTADMSAYSDTPVIDPEEPKDNSTTEPTDNGTVTPPDVEEPDVPAEKDGLKVSTTRVKFAETVIKKKSTTKSVTITNNGTNSVTLDFTAPSEPFIILSSSTCKDGGTLNAGASCKINAQFVPIRVDEFRESAMVTTSGKNKSEALEIEFFGVATKTATTTAVPAGGCSTSSRPDMIFVFLIFAAVARILFRKVESK